MPSVAHCLVRMVQSMPRKLLQWIGVAAVLGLLAVAIGALMLVKDRVTLVLQAEASAAGPDPVALLRDDVQTLQRELGELRSQLGGNFEHLGAALEERAVARHAELQASAREVAQQHLQQQHAAERAAAAQLLSLQAELAALRSSLPVAGNRVPAADVSPGVAAGPTTEPAPGQTPVGENPVGQNPVGQNPAGEPSVGGNVPAGPEPTPTKETPAAAKAGSFLSFSVPAAKFQFDQSQTYTLLSDLCRVGFDAKSTLHDFTGVTGKVAGRFVADFDDPAGAWTGEVTCEAGTLKTGVDGRDTNMWEYLDAPHHAQIRFELGKFEATKVDVGARTAAGTLHGRMTIRGKTRDVSMPITVATDSSLRLQIEGQMPLKLSDYEVPVPSQLGGTITMQDEVKVWIALRARVQVGGAR